MQERGHGAKSAGLAVPTWKPAQGALSDERGRRSEVELLPAPPGTKRDAADGARPCYKSGPILEDGVVLFEQAGEKTVRRRSVVIIGGGLAGLNAARLLQEADIDFELVEARDRLAGVCQFLCVWLARVICFTGLAR